MVHWAEFGCNTNRGTPGKDGSGSEPKHCLQSDHHSPDMPVPYSSSSVIIKNITYVEWQINMHGQCMHLEWSNVVRSSTFTYIRYNSPQKFYYTVQMYFWKTALQCQEISKLFLASCSCHCRWHRHPRPTCVSCARTVRTSFTWKRNRVEVPLMQRSKH